MKSGSDESSQKCDDVIGDLVTSGADSTHQKFSSCRSGNGIDSPNLLALPAAPRDDAHAGMRSDGLRGGRDVLLDNADAHGLGAEASDAAPGPRVGVRERAEEMSGLAHEANAKRRRIRGKQPCRRGVVSPVLAGGAASRDASLTPRRRDGLDVERDAMDVLANSVHDAAVAAEGIRVEHRAQGSGRGPSQLPAELSTEQRSSCHDNREGPQPTSSSQPVARCWSASSGRPPDASEAAA